MWRIRWNVKRFWVGELDLDRVDLADLTGIRPGTIGEIMKDAHDSISLEDLAKICEVLHRNVDEVLLLVKDTDELEGEERDKAILDAVQEARARRIEKNAERRSLKKEADERRIQEAVKKALVEYGIIEMPIIDDDIQDDQDPDTDND